MEKIPFPLAGTELYRPLNSVLQQIRLLTILPGNFNDEVRCIMNVASLHHDLVRFYHYETISYVWGNARLRSSIRVNGERVNIPKSSMAALRRMRLTDLERVVWIDALCINQDDNSEKSTQVALMSKIYRYGDRNLVFLGDDDDNVAEEVQRMVNSKTVQLSQLMEGLSPNEVITMPERMSRAAIDGGLNHDLLKRLYDLPWFRRLWVMQEAVMARSSRCYWGTARIRLIDIVLIANFLNTPGPRFSLGTKTAARMVPESMLWRHNISSGPGYRSFFEVAQRSNEFMATDARDYVFAFAALFEKSPQSRTISTLIVPDYTKSIQEVFRDATRYTLEDNVYDANDILTQIQHISQGELEASIASWKLQFGCSSALHEAMRALFWLPRDCCAGFRERKRMPESRLTISGYPVADPNVLTLKVAVLDTIAQTTTPVLRCPAIEDFATVWRVVEKVQAMTNFNYKVAALVLTAGIGNGSYDWEFTDLPHLWRGYHAFQRHARTHDKVTPAFVELMVNKTARPEATEAMAARYYHMLQRAIFNRRLFKTVSGLVGCGPQLMKPGDRVVIPENAWFPCVLRPVGEHYLFLGAAYVHGMMHGEVFDRKDVEWTMVDIR